MGNVDISLLGMQPRVMEDSTFEKNIYFSALQENAQAARVSDPFSRLFLGSF